MGLADLPGRQPLRKKEIVMRIFDLALKDLLQIVRDWKAAFFLILMTLISGAAVALRFMGFGAV